MTNRLSHLEKIKAKERHEFRREWIEKKENEARKLWLKDVKALRNAD